MEGTRRWNKCAKNPGHPTFIPVTEFSIGHLPQPYQIPEVFDLITNITERTVRLRVGYTSLARPDGYVFSEFRGQKTSHAGSGWVRDLEVRNSPCRCRACDSKKTLYNKWWLIRVYTSCHVVYDTSEAVETDVDLFYDSEASRKPGGGMVTIQGIKATYRDEDHDSCKFYCATHDEQLIKKLTVLTSRWEKIPKGLMDVESLCVVISHPHGKSKHITVGEMKGSTEEIFGLTKTYNTDTCGGSSGAPVVFPRRRADQKGWVPIMFAHSQGLGNGLNKSAIGASRSY
ncbi:hypothetical protein ElyMa_001903400 [Elysia marginata]|uniref:Peptidase S1 domain-containing protein n=1 Tax=Elysia marginata TaxID=1093978 RepID=A0AAV4ET21_9GAST|nr:hypothetical protein ElyMa_001903400 [Elysia marginata]